MQNMYRDMREAWNKATNAVTEAEFPPPSQSKPASPQAAVPVPRTKPTAAPASTLASRAQTESQELPAVLPGDVAHSSGATSPPDTRPVSPGPRSPPAGASAATQLKYMLLLYSPYAPHICI